MKLSGGTIEPLVDARSAERRRVWGGVSGEGVSPSPVMGSRGVTPGKF